MPHVRLFRIVFIPFLACILAGQSVLAVSYYVAVDGDDGATGSAQQPWQTLQHAADEVAAGDIVLVRSGIYAGFKAMSSGDEGNPITFRPDGNAQIVLSSPSPDNWHGSIVEIEWQDWWVVEGFEVTGSAIRAGIDVREADHVTVRHCYSHHNHEWGIFTAYTDYFTAEHNECAYSADEHGIYVSNSSDHVILRYNRCHHNNACGIQINADPDYPGDKISSNCTVRYNILYENGQGGGAAVNLASVRDSFIADNLIYSNHAGGIAGWDNGAGTDWGTRENKFYNNTVHQPATARWALNLKNGSTGNDIKNNILIHEGSRGGLELDSSSLSGLNSDYNLMVRVNLDETAHSLGWWQSAYSQDTHSQDHPALETFVQPGEDYRLLKTAWAVDNGLALYQGAKDLCGRLRPAGDGWDLGCLERGAVAFNGPMLLLLE